MKNHSQSSTNYPPTRRLPTTHYQLPTSNGFTLLEILLSVGLITILAGLSMPVAQRFQVQNDVLIASTTIAQNMRRAQIESQAVNGDSTWGIKIQSGSVVVFQGTNYASRVTTYDETFDLPTSITPTGLGEVVFAKMTGLPTTTGTVTLTDNAGVVKTIVINSMGNVTY